MNQVIESSPLLAGSALLAVLAFPAEVRAAPSPVGKPFQAHVMTAIVHDDNVFRLKDGSEGAASIGTRDLADWHARFGAGFESVLDVSNQELELEGNLYRRVNDRFDELDHTGGRARAAWNWRASDATRGNLGYRFRRDLRQFSNRDVAAKDIVEENTLFAGIDQRLAQRWSLRAGVDHADLQFTASPQLEKQRLDLESELQYDASQDSRFGLLARYTRSRFDVDSAQDFGGWSIGPSLEWQFGRDLKFSADLGYTHQSLDDSPPGVDDFDGVTGAAVIDWRPSDRLRWKVRAFRDISDLGGEVPRYTERTGLSIVPRWQISEKLEGRAEFTYEKRDFVEFTTTAPRREDDWYLANAWLDLRVARRWLVSAGVGTEYRSSTVESQEFDDLTVQLVIRFDIR